jgi:pimeloyl-ACP methyl ester carboxylesterase
VNNADTQKPRKAGRKMAIVAAIVILLLTAACIILPPSLGKVTPFRDSEGNIIEGSISEKLQVEINGASLGMFIMAKDGSKPVLLFLGGGPGIPEYFLEQIYPSSLADEFIVCYLEYRGTSLSYSTNISLDALTTEQYLSDVAEVTDYLRERFGQDKIYLMGHSFGTYIGLLAASQNPQAYHAYIAMSQIANQYESEKIAYSYMLEQYRLLNNDKMAAKLEKYPILTDEDAYQRYFSSSLRDTAMHELGVGTTRDMRSVISGIFFPSLRCAVYKPTERINIWRGKAFLRSSQIVTDCTRFNAFESVSSLEIPVYFLAGKYDYTCAYPLQLAYYEHIRAPQKGFYTFENSAHSPLFEETGKAQKILKDIIDGSIKHSE